MSRQLPLAWVVLGNFLRESVYFAALKSVIGGHCLVRPQLFQLAKT